jgi:CRP-like cAMP-binding protein
MQQGVVLTEAGDEVDQIYFPQYGMLSLLAVLRDGKAIETATVGREGVVGAMAGLGLYKSLVRVVVQMPVSVSKIAASHFMTEVASKVQAVGAITYSRGVIKILDRPALMRMSCECYETLIDQSAALA